MSALWATPWSVRYCYANERATLTSATLGSTRKEPNLPWACCACAVTISCANKAMAKRFRATGGLGFRMINNLIHQVKVINTLYRIYDRLLWFYWYLTGISASVMQRCPSNFKTIERLQIQITGQLKFIILIQRRTFSHKLLSQSESMYLMSHDVKW